MRRNKHNLNKLKLLQFVHNCRPHNRRFLIDNLKDNSVDILCESVYNICHTNLGLSKRVKNKIIIFWYVQIRLHSRFELCRFSEAPLDYWKGPFSY